MWVIRLLRFGFSRPSKAVLSWSTVARGRPIFGFDACQPDLCGFGCCVLIAVGPVSRSCRSTAVALGQLADRGFVGRLLYIDRSRFDHCGLDAVKPTCSRTRRCRLIDVHRSLWVDCSELVSGRYGSCHSWSVAVGQSAVRYGLDAVG